MRKCVELRISKGLRAVALATGINRRVHSETQVIIHPPSSRSREDRATPYHLGIRFSGLLGELFPSRSLVVFITYPEKAIQKKLGLDCCHSLDHTEIA